MTASVEGRLRSTTLERRGGRRRDRMVKLLIGWAVVSVPVGVLVGTAIRLRERSPETRISRQDRDIEPDEAPRRAAS